MVMDSEKILLIEDSKEDSGSFSGLLKEKGYNISCATNGSEGLKQIKQERFDLIILDLLLPDMKGEELYSRIKSERRSKNIPIIILSAKDDIEGIEELFEKGVDDYIIKPPRPDYLISRIKMHVKGTGPFR